MDFEFYKLTSNPFVQQSSSTLFWSPSHCNAWQNLVEGIERRQSFIFVLGQSGLGTTALYKAYLNQANPQKLTVLHDIDITVDFVDLLVRLLQLCGLDGAADNPRVLTEELHQALLRAYQQGRRTVLLIDEAHALPAHAWHNLSLLSDAMQHETGHLLPIVLFGRPTLTQRQDLPRSQHFALGLARAAELAPLAHEHSLAYINHCLKQAATEPSTVFSRGALNLIATHARGVPNVINIMCTDVLVAGLLQGEKPISAKTVRSVIGDVADVGLMPWPHWSLVGIGGLLLAMAIWQLLPATRPAMAPETHGAQVARVSSQEPHISSPPVSIQSNGAAPPLPSDPAATSLASAPHVVGRTRSLALTEPTPQGSEAEVTTQAREMFATLETSPQQRETAPETSATADLPHPALSPVGDNNAPTTSFPSSSESAETTSMHDLSRTRMVCVMPRQGGTPGSDIVLVDRQVDGVNRLIADGAQNLSPALSPDGTLLAYTSYRGGVPNIYLRDLKTGTEQQLTSGPWLALPGTWSPNGRYLALSQSLNGNYDIFIYDAQRQRLQRLTTSAAVDVSPSFAPDSTRLVFASDRSGSPQLYLTDVTASPPKRLTQEGPYNTSPAWSPRDNTIAFIGRSTNRSLDLYLIQADGSQLRRLTRGQRFHTPPTWAPDGQVLMGMSLRQAKWEQHMVSLTPAGIDTQDLAQNLFRLDTPCLAPQWVAQHVP